MSGRLLALLALLYFAQGLPSGLIAKALPALLRDQGVSLSLIGFTSALALPWALKFLWAPLIDRFGTRKQWLLALNGLSMALMLVVASQDFDAWVARLPWLLAVLFCANVISATQDIATDGYAITQLQPEWRGLGNSIQVVGYKLGMVMGSGGLLWLVSRHGWQASYGSLACLMLLVIVPVLFMDDARTPIQQSATHTEWHGLRGYAGLFRGFVARPGLGWWLATIALYKFGDSLASRMTGPLLTDSGFSLAQIGVITGVAGATAGVIGAFVGGATLLRIGHREALLAFGALQALGSRELPAGRRWRSRSLCDRGHRVFRAVRGRPVDRRLVHAHDGPLPRPCAGHRLLAAGLVDGDGHGRGRDDRRPVHRPVRLRRRLRHGRAPDAARTGAGDAILP